MVFLPLNNSETESVYFVGHYQDDGVLKIGGTAILVALPVVGQPSERYMYFVTAGHVIDHAQLAVIRVPRGDEGVLDLTVHDWVTHPQYDVAVAPLLTSEVLNQPIRLSYLEPDIFADDDSWASQFPWLCEIEPHFGDIVHVVGLFAKLPKTVEKLVSVVRSGNLAQLWQSGLPVRRKNQPPREITAHMIDCRIFGGMSGAPCFIEQQRAFVDTEGDKITVGTSYRNALLGLIGGHFEDWVPTLDEAGESYRPLRSVVNTGISYVIPIEHVRSIFRMDEILEQMIAGGNRMQVI